MPNKKSDITEYYKRILFKIRTLAKIYGYAIAFHGSGHRDLDLIAVPWTEDACDAEILVKELLENLQGFASSQDIYPIIKPHGRKCWVLFIPDKPGYGCRGYVDLSVMPKRSHHLHHANVVETNRKEMK